MQRHSPDQLLDELTSADDLLIVQDLDGVCMQLVKDPHPFDRPFLCALGRCHGGRFCGANQR